MKPDKVEGGTQGRGGDGQSVHGNSTDKYISTRTGCILSPRDVDELLNVTDFLRLFHTILRSVRARTGGCMLAAHHGVDEF